MKGLPPSKAMKSYSETERGICGGSDLQCAHPGCKGEQRVRIRRAGTCERTATSAVPSLACRKLGGLAARRCVRQGIAISVPDRKNTATRQGLFGVGLTVKESLCSMSGYTHQFVDERLMSIRF